MSSFKKAPVPPPISKLNPPTSSSSASSSSSSSSSSSWVKSKSTPNGQDGTLSAFLHKQSAKAPPAPGKPKSYKKKWCWFQADQGTLYYHQSGSMNSGSETSTPLSIGYLIKSIHIDSCIVEASTLKQEFVITHTGPSKRKWIWKAEDAATAQQWVSGLNAFKQRTPAASGKRPPAPTPGTATSASSSQPDATPTQAAPSPAASASPTSFVRGESGNKSASGADGSTSPSLQPISSASSNSSSNSSESLLSSTDKNKNIAEQFLKSLSINCEAGLDRASGKQSFGAVKIRQLLVRQSPPLDSDQINYILSLLQSQITYMQECYEEIQKVSESNKKPVTATVAHTKPLTTATTSGKPAVPPKSTPPPPALVSLPSLSNMDDDDEDDAHPKEDSIFSLLPNHLSLYILSFLDAKQLLLCATVSSRWFQLSTDNVLWLRFTTHLQTPASVFDTGRSWKTVYLSHRKQSTSTKEKNMSRAISIYGLPAITSTSGKSVKEGYLYKRGEDILRIWKKRYFVLKENCLFYFQHPNDNFPCGMIPLQTTFRVKRVSPSTRKHCFKIIHDGLQSCKQKTGVGMTVERKEPYYLSADTDEECNAWMTIVLESIQKSDRLPSSSSSSSTSSISPTKVIGAGVSGNRGSSGSSNSNPGSGSNSQHRSFNPKPSNVLKAMTGKKSSNSTPISAQSLTSDHSTATTKVETPSRALFGLPLSVLMAEQSKHISLPIPFILNVCFEAIQAYGLQEEGLFRVSGSVLEIEALKTIFEQNTTYTEMDLQQSDIHAVTGLVKSFFRKLPHSLIPKDLDEYATSVSLAQSQTIEQKINEFKFIFESLDPVVYNIFRSLLALLRQTVENKATTKMTEDNVLIVIMPTLKCKPVLVDNGIRYYHQIFNSTSSSSLSSSASED
ncbi:hypothetical protein SAMD00019534_081240 [Acytostelium subglobosum LB1]|uniref:hypothetical protein n=1 Tax=Acytostelium subglobosum LB1 TaxID=1410327 RepID=UPI000645027A|nr:hypothetical protein SAMD00019534_081240 [Acytostelium subglobosum LB1]GAM24949.1 hypothetical protein SAMD00019534_081240 [Acytostelium subglobosum LB1]|eukprot:XP_012752038.1 hypothetical protein SAMD00019534_081240 [Acytostelium subglobosum LB1]